MLNKVTLIGNLGKDPESRTFPNGGTVCNVSLATTETWRDRSTGERKDATEWHNLVFNDRLAEIASKYLKKGSKVYVEGSIKTRKWQDQNGQDRYMTEIRVREMKMLDSRVGGADGGQAYNQQQQMPQQQQQQMQPQQPQQPQYQQQPQQQQQQQQMQPQYQPEQPADYDDDIPF